MRRRHAEHALNKVAARLREGVPVDWQDIVSRFTMDSATEFLFGKDVCSLDAPIPYPSTYQRTANALADCDRTAVHPADQFVNAFQAGQEATAMRSRFLQSWPLFEFWGDKVEKQLGAVHRFIDPIVEGALRRKAERQRVGEDVIEKEVRDDETLLEHLVKLTDGRSSRGVTRTRASETYTDARTRTDAKVIKDETLNILLAGRDTTACTLTFSVYALAEHPAVLARLRKDVLDVVGPTRRPTYEDIREMKYMRAFINEVLRLYPPVCVIFLLLSANAYTEAAIEQTSQPAVRITAASFSETELTACHEGAPSRLRHGRATNQASPTSTSRPTPGAATLSSSCTAGRTSGDQTVCPVSSLPRA